MDGATVYWARLRHSSGNPAVGFSPWDGGLWATFSDLPAGRYDAWVDVYTGDTDTGLSHQELGRVNCTIPEDPPPSEPEPEPDPDPEDEPANLSCTANGSSITLTWDAVDGADSYEVLVLGEQPIEHVTTATSITLEDLSPGLYLIAVHALRDGEAGPGNGVGCLIHPPDLQLAVALTAAPPGDAPDPPPEPDAGLDAPGNVSCTATSSSITLRWEATTGVDSYGVSVSGGLETTRATVGTSIVFRDLQPGVYRFSVYSMRGDGTGPPEGASCLIHAPDPPPQGPLPLPEGQTAAFDDVTGTDALGHEVLAAAQLGIVTAVEGSNYEPGRVATRAEIVAPLVRLWQVLGGSCPRGGALFGDTAPGQLRSDAACLRAVGITTGTTPTTYSPERQVTRAQAASFFVRMWRQLGQACPATAGLTFDDVNPESVHAADIACLHALDITTGTTATTYSPNGLVTRAQVAAFGVRLHERFTGDADDAGT